MLLFVFSSLLFQAFGEFMCDDKKEFTPMEEQFKFKLMDLPYCHEYIEPVLPDEIMKAHHDKHHDKYVSKLNKFLEERSDLQSLTLVELQSEAKNEINLEKYAGGDYNHRMYWWVLTSPFIAKAGPEGSLLTQIEEDFGSFEGFKTAFEDLSNGLFGSGWTWACVNDEGHIEIRETQDQINPLMEITGDKCYPFFLNDIWEHAYYLEYLWDRSAYITKYWSIIDWDTVQLFYEEYASKGVAIPLG